MAGVTFKGMVSVTVKYDLMTYELFPSLVRRGGCAEGADGVVCSKFRVAAPYDAREALIINRYFRL